VLEDVRDDVQGAAEQAPFAMRNLSGEESRRAALLVAAEKSNAAKGLSLRGAGRLADHFDVELPGGL
jgi:hypothetical protein